MSLPSYERCLLFITALCSIIKDSITGHTVLDFNTLGGKDKSVDQSNKKKENTDSSQHRGEKKEDGWKGKEEGETRRTEEEQASKTRLRDCGRK